MSAARLPLPSVPGKTYLEAGARVGKYTVEFLAAGGMSVVYRGQCGTEVVALKEVAVDNTAEVPSLMSEKALLERLDHPGLVGFIDFLIQDGFYYLVVELVEGHPMSRWIDQERASDTEIVEWGCQLTETFEYLHAAKPPIIYRDLKPGNVMVTPQGQAKLIDFGIARLHKGGRHQDTSLLGSLQTASPEHYGMAETDARSDIYTLGMTLYLLFTGGAMKKQAFMISPLASVRPDLPQHIVAAIDKSVMLEPERRHQSMAEFRAALRPDDCQPEKAAVEDDDGEGPALCEATVALPHLKLESPPANPGKLRRALPALLVVLLFGVLAVGLLYRDSVRAVATAPAAAMALDEKNFPVDLFAGVTRNGNHLVMLGEEIGLFQVSDAQGETAEKRSVTIAERLNGFYRAFCPLCGGSKLEPGDIRVGSYGGSTVVFYAHQHGDEAPVTGPLLLATVTLKQAKEMGMPARFVAGYWRDLLRDTVQLSRGLASGHSALGEDVEQALLRARAMMSGDQADTHNLQAVLRNLTGSEARSLQDLYRRVPERPPAPDEFQNLGEYQPLRI